MTENLQLGALLAACHWIGQKGWSPATGGNMSVRSGEEHCLITESGKDKGSLTAEDFLLVELASGLAPAGRRPSAETGLHTMLYAHDPQIGAVLHTHSVNSTVLSSTFLTLFSSSLKPMLSKYGKPTLDSLCHGWFGSS